MALLITDLCFLANNIEENEDYEGKSMLDSKARGDQDCFVNASGGACF
jgi:hypothetical protein